MLLGPRLRRVALSAHIAVSVSWVGAVAAYLALDVTVATSDDAATLQAAYVAMGIVAQTVILPLAVAALATGIVMGFCTKWGLFRHWWVVISLFLTLAAVFVLLVELEVVRHYARVAGDPASTAADIQALGSTLLHSVGGLVVLLLVLLINIYKPRGWTRYGWRKHLEERAQGAR